MEFDFDIAIVGGGPAGSTAALYLSKMDFKVALFEMKSFPRNTVCGEFISGEINEILDELNLSQEFLLLNPNPINSFSIIHESGKKTSSDLGFTGYGIQRSSFDTLLLDKVKESNVKIFQPAKVLEISTVDEGYKVDYNNRTVDKFLYVKNVIAAYGKQNYLDKKLNRHFIEEKTSMNGVKFQVDNSFLENFDKNSIQIYTADNIYCGVNSVDNEMATVCFLENRKDYSGSPRQHLKDLLHKNKAFSRIFRKGFEELVDELPVYGCGNIYFGKRFLVERGIYIIGDAAGIIAPLSGDGIAMAMQCGKLIATVLNEQKERNLSEKISQELFVNNWLRLFKSRISMAKKIQNVLLNKRLRWFGLNFLKLYPSLLKRIILKTRGNINKKLNFINTLSQNIIH